ncbi:MAG: hypothetical protein F6J89_20760 [Symploca sp. SIO1C4]|uniref:Uncharacterized protein n=1 Tax=Symploca sp. SIO1C4 TaxID=2607765 RepID=A0A6B3NEG5_9CYAN|nr:hypothetical protein [Symploca sp. SIO1C4]
MNAKEQLKRYRAIRMAYWLAPLPKVNFPKKTPIANFSEDQGIGHYFSTDESNLPDLGPLADFGSWESVASTIERQIWQMSGFNPSDTEFDEEKWEQYEHTFLSAPFWLETDSQYEEAEISSLSLKPAVDKVTDMLSSIVSEDTLDAIVTSIKKIAQLAMENKGLEQKDNYKQQGVISIKSGSLYSGFVRTTVAMIYKTGKGYEQLTQDLTIRKLHGSLDFDACKEYSDIIHEWDRHDIGEWTTVANSYPYPPNNSPAWDN